MAKVQLNIIAIYMKMPLPCNRYWGLFPRGENDRGVNIMAHPI